MSEIKFRAWCKKDKLMYYGIQNGIKFEDDSIYDFSRFLGNQKADDYHEWELMQFTGLLDKSGKEIYESDIVRFKHGEQGKKEFYEKIETVSFWRGSFCLGSKSLHDWYTDKDGNLTEKLSHFQQTINRIDFYYRDFDSEVIGNIYEQPVTERTKE